MRSLHLATLLGASLLLAAACSSSQTTGGLAEGVGAGTGTGTNSSGAGASGTSTSGSSTSTTTSGFTTSTSSAGPGGASSASAGSGASSTTSSGAGGASTSSSGAGGASTSSSGMSSTSSSGTSSSGMSSSGTASSGSTSSTTGASSSSGGPVTFGGACNGTTTTLTGTVYAPNGKDPIPNVRVYALMGTKNPYPASYCDKCSSPVDDAYDSTKSAPDGTFTLTLDDVPQAAQIQFGIQIGRFRKITPLNVTSCTTAAVPVAAETLPGSSAAGDIPRMAVSTGNVDHLDAILANLGITEYDCYEGRVGTSAGTTSATCPLSLGKNIADVLTDAATLDTYNMAFLSCAPSAYGTFTTPKGTNYQNNTKYPGQGYSQSTMTANTQSWVSANGGRLFVTDTAYDYIAQAFPQPITWEGQAGSPQPVDAANVGCAPTNASYPNAHAVLYPVNIDDSTLAAWLKVVGFSSSPSVQIQGFYQPWSTMASLAAGTTQIADGTMPVDLISPLANVCGATANVTMQDVPLTAQFDAGTCGRVIFSSYHTYSGTGVSANAANAKIMEYLIFGAAVCRG